MSKSGGRFANALSHARLHTDGAAAALANQHGARAVTRGRDIYFAPGAYAPHTPAGQRLLAHELTHVAQHRRGGAVPRVSRRGDAAELEARANERALATGAEPTFEAPPVALALDGELLRAGDRVRITLTMPSGDVLGASEILEVQANGEVEVASLGARVNVAALDLGQARDRIAAQLSRTARLQLTVELRPVRIGGRDLREQEAARDRRAERVALFRAYVMLPSLDAGAVNRFNEWLRTHADTDEIFTREPSAVFREALAPPRAPTSPQYEATQLFLRFIEARRAQAQALQGAEARRETEAIRRFLAWMDANQAALVRTDPGTLYGRFLAGATIADIDREVARAAAAARAPRPWTDAEVVARVDHRDRFLQRARQLWADSSRHFPYSIPVPSQGRDILVTGHPARQRVLDDLAAALMAWCGQHLQADDFMTTTPEQVLLRLLDEQGFQRRLNEANAQPLESESIDRHELLWGQVARTFGTTLAGGILGIAVVALALALGVPGLFVGGALVLLAGISGVGAYLSRRAEVDQTNFRVPRIESAVAAAGDVFGVSQLVEGFTGQRLGTREQLTSMQRSDATGAGLGTVATQILGSRAFRGVRAPNEPVAAPRPNPPVAPARPPLRLVSPVEPTPAAPPVAVEPPPVAAPRGNVIPIRPRAAAVPDVIPVRPRAPAVLESAPANDVSPPPTMRAAANGGAAPAPRPVEVPIEVPVRPRPQLVPAPEPAAPPAEVPIAGRPRVSPNQLRLPFPTPTPVVGAQPSAGGPPQQPQAPLHWNTSQNFSGTARNGGVNGALDFRYAGPSSNYRINLPSAPMGLPAYLTGTSWQLDGHHVWPKYLGGPEVAPLLAARWILHIGIIHALIDGVVGAVYGVRRNSPAAVRAAFVNRMLTDRLVRRRVEALLREVYVTVNTITAPQMPAPAYELGIAAGLQALGGP